MSNNQDSYVKVEDTLPGQQLAKGQQDVSWPTDPQRKSLRTLGSFSNPQSKKAERIAEPVEHQHKEDTTVQTTILQSKDKVQVEDVPQSLSKTTVSVSAPVHGSKDSESIESPATASSKNGAQIEDKVTGSHKTSQTVAETAPSKKDQQYIANPSDHQSKSSDSVSVESSLVSKDEEVVNVNGVYRNKEGNPVAVFKDHLKKGENDIGLSDDHQSKKSTAVKPEADLEKTEAEIDTNHLSHKSKGAINIDASAPSVSAKEAGDDIGVASDPTLLKGEIEPESTDGQSISELLKPSKEAVETESTTPGSKEELELEKLSAHGTKSESGINTERTHQEKKKYSYDELLAMYLKQVEEAQSNKKATAGYTTSIDNEHNKAFSESSHVDFTKVPQLSKSDQTTADYSTALDDKTSKAFDDVLPTDIPFHTKNPKLYPEGTSENDIPSVTGFDLKEGEVLGADNFVLSMSDRTNEKTDDDISDNTIAVDGVDSTSITAPSSSFDDRNYFKRTSGKIADKGSQINTYDSSDPKVLSTDADAVEYSEVRNTSEYKPVYDWTNLIPARTGLADILKTVTQTFGLSKYIAAPAPQPEFGDPVLGMDWLRFGQRALTGEVSRYVFSRLQSSVLYGHNSDKKKERLNRPVELSTSGVLDQADKIFDILSPAVNLITANPADLLKNQEELDFRGLLKGMGNQIDKSASGMFSSMGNYYNAVRAKITSRFNGYQSNITEIDEKIKHLSERIAMQSQYMNEDYNSHKNPIDGRYEPSQHDYDNYALERLKKKKNTYEQNIRKLNIQYASVLINFDSPSEYRKYINPLYDPTKPDNQDFTWSVSMKRSKEGPELVTGEGAPTDTYKAFKEFDWREFNLNRKPNSIDDFDSEKGYLNFSQTGSTIELVKKVCESALAENPIFDNKEKRDKAINDMFDFKYLMVDYDTDNNGFTAAIKEIITNGDAEKGKETNAYVVINPDKSMANLYAAASTPDRVEYRYYDINNKQEVTNSKGSDIPNFDDPHLTSLLEKQVVSTWDVRSSFVSDLETSNDDRLKSAKDQIYQFESDGVANYINLASINFGDNKVYFSNVQQDTDAIKGNESDKDAFRHNQSVLYQATLNYLSNKGSIKAEDRRKIRDNILTIIAKKDDGELPLGSGLKKDSSLYVFNWFDDNTKTDDKSADIMDILKDANKFTSSQSHVSTYADYNADSKKIIDGFYQRRIALNTKPNNPDEEIKNQKDLMVGRNIKKQIIPIGLSMVSSSKTDNITAVVVASPDPDNKDAGNFYETKYVLESNKGSVKPETESITESKNPKAFTFKTTASGEDGEYVTSRDMGDNSYYKTIRDSRKKLDSQTEWGMTIQISKKPWGEVKIRETGLGGILVSANTTMDKEKGGGGNLYFEIPFQFNPEISGESRSANWNSVTAFGRTHDHFVYANTSARSVQFKTTYAITDCLDKGEAFDRFGKEINNSSESGSSTGIERNDTMAWAKGWTENYILMIMNMYRSLVLPINAYSAVTPPVVTIDFGKLLGTYTRIDADKYLNARWVVSEYSIDPNLDAGYTLNKTPRLFDVTLSLKEVFNGWHDLQDFYTINKHLKEWADGGTGLSEPWQSKDMTK